MNTQATRPVSRSRLVRDDARARVEALQAAALKDQPAAIATLARLRRCPVDQVGADPSVWQVTLGDLPDQLVYGDDPTPAERAMHATLVLYAHHQQAHDDPTHVRGIRLGTAVGRLARARSTNGEPDESTIRRLHQVGLATEHSTRLRHLRSLVMLMRPERPTIALDYGHLAVDLWRLFDPRHDNTRVLARWGRDLYSTPKTTDQEN